MLRLLLWVGLLGRRVKFYSSLISAQVKQKDVIVCNFEDKMYLVAVALQSFIGTLGPAVLCVCYSSLMNGWADYVLNPS